MKRLFWLGLGFAVGAELTREVRRLAQKLTPAGVGESVAEGLRELASALGEFGAEVRSGMAEREDELAEMVDERTGIRVGTRAVPPAGRVRQAGE